MTVPEIAARLFELNGSVVEVDIRSAFNPHQTSPNDFEFNIESAGKVAVVILSAQKGNDMFPKGKKSGSAPAYMRVKVSHGQVQNQFGSVTEGPLLYSAEWPPAEAGPTVNNQPQINGNSSGGDGKVKQLISSISNYPSDWSNMSTSDKRDFIRKQLSSKGLSLSEARQAVENLNP